MRLTWRSGRIGIAPQPNKPNLYTANHECEFFKNLEAQIHFH